MSAASQSWRRPLSLSTARRIATHATALAAFLAMTTSGELPPLAMGLFGAGTLLSLFKGERRVPAAPLTVLTAGVGLGTIFLVAQGALDLVLGASLFAAALCLNRLLLRRSAADDPLLLLTTLLMLAAGAALSGEVSYGACFALYGLAATPALTFSHLERAADEAGLTPTARDALLSRGLVGALLGLAGLSLLGAATLFVIFPRMNAQVLGRHHGAVRAPVVGFSDKVQLGGLGALRSDPRPALRVRFPGLQPTQLPAKLLDPEDGRLSLLWRGRTLESFDGRAWASAPARKGERARIMPPFPTGAVELHVLVDVLPAAAVFQVFSPGAATAAVVTRAETGNGHNGASVRELPSGDLDLTAAPVGGFAYELWTRPLPTDHLRGAGRAYPPAVAAHDLQLPEKLDPRIPALARSWVGARTDPAEQAQAIRDHLRTDYRYTTELPGEVADPLAGFLFDRKAGHCEYFSTAMVVLLRTLGVPAREVTGFAGGELAPGGDDFIVRAGDAHSWAEVYFPGQGFLPFDPTPPIARSQGPHGFSAWLAGVSDTISARWSAAVVDYDLRSQLNALQKVGEAFSHAAERFSREPQAGNSLPWSRIAVLLGGGLAVLGLIARLLRMRRDRATPVDEAARAFTELSLRLQRRGLPRAPSETVRELSARLAAEHKPEAEAVNRFAALYEGARYAGAPWTPAQRAEVQAVLRTLRR